MNTKLIPVSSGYAGRCMNALGAPVTGIGQEMPAFHGVGSPAPDGSNWKSVYEPFTISITAIDAMSRGVGPKLIIGNRDIAKSAVTIDRIIDQDACN